MIEQYIFPGMSLAVLLSIIWALHGITQQQIKNLQERLEQEATRLKDNTDKAERRLDDSTRLAEQRLKDETTKAEARLAESLATADQRKVEHLVALESKMELRIDGAIAKLEATSGLQFAELRNDINWLKERAKNGAKQGAATIRETVK